MADPQQDGDDSPVNNMLRPVFTGPSLQAMSRYETLLERWMSFTRSS